MCEAVILIKLVAKAPIYIGVNIHRSQGDKRMVMLEEQQVPKVSASVRWN
jgi:hypothetical protein